jgi:hypothetical protein
MWTDDWSALLHIDLLIVQGEKNSVDISNLLWYVNKILHFQEIQGYVPTFWKVIQF